MKLPAAVGAIVALLAILSLEARADELLRVRVKSSLAPLAGSSLEATVDEAPAWRVRVDYLERESAVELEDYLRFEVGRESDSRWFNPGGGVEFRINQSQLRSYWFGDDIMLTDRTQLNLRLCHVQYDDWQAAINHANFYFSYRRAWFKGAVGMGYAALVFEEENYRNPFQYGSQAPESRIIYNLSVVPSFLDGRIEVDVGLRNFDNFEYHGADDNGYHVEPSYHLDQCTAVRLFYERRYAGVFVGAPTLTRITWMVSLEHRF